MTDSIDVQPSTKINPKPSTKRPHGFYAGLLIMLTLWMSLPGLFSIPVIDRDEARYAQATVQMVESGDYVQIKFQDDARNKKPVGIYWMQAGPVKAFTHPGERKIWAHRLPSVLGAMIAVLATYWGGILVLGRRGAFVGAAILATSALFVFEAHIAKTDAMLCGMSALVLASLLRLRNGDSPKIAIMFWVAMAVGILVKGPIVPAIVIPTLLGVFIWERSGHWMRVLINWPGIVLALLIVVPWMVMISFATDGAFFKDAIGGDLAPKLAGAQEKHGGLPGYYLTTLPILFWPGCLFLIAGLVFGVKAARHKGDDSGAIGHSMRLLIMWIIPFWAVLEIVPTKLPNYLLPLYPALALLCGGVIMALLSVQSFKVSRRLGAVIYLIVTVALVTTVLSGEALYAPEQNILLFILGGFCVALAFACIWAVWSGRVQKGVFVAGVTTLILTPAVYQLILPRLETLHVSHRVEAALNEASVTLPRNDRRNETRILAPSFTEPSLVYRLGQDVILGERATDILKADLQIGDIVLFDTDRRAMQEELTQIKTELQNVLESRSGFLSVCLEELSRVKGVNYSKGDNVRIDVLRATACVVEEELELDASNLIEATEAQPVP